MRFLAYSYLLVLQTPTLLKEFGPVDYIDFSPVEPYHFAVTCSVRVRMIIILNVASTGLFHVLSLHSDTLLILKKNRFKYTILSPRLCGKTYLDFERLLMVAHSGLMDVSSVLVGKKPLFGCLM